MINDGWQDFLWSLTKWTRWTRWARTQTRWSGFKPFDECKSYVLPLYLSLLPRLHTQQSKFHEYIQAMTTITREQSICMFFCEEYNEANVARWTKKIGAVENIDIYYKDDPTNPFYIHLKI